MRMLFLKIPNISVLFVLKVEIYGSTSSFLVCVHVLKSESLWIDLAFIMSSEITISRKLRFCMEVRNSDRRFSLWY